MSHYERKSKIALQVGPSSEYDVDDEKKSLVTSTLNIEQPHTSDIFVL